MKPILFIFIPIIVLVLGIAVWNLAPIAIDFYWEKRIRENGVSMIATVVNVSDTGVLINRKPIVRVDVVLAAPDGVDYRAYAKVIIEGNASAIYFPGKQITVKFDATNPARVVIVGWSASTAPAPPFQGGVR